MSGLPQSPQSLRVGCIGGGQLGRMLALEAPRLNISMSFLDPMGQNSPAAAVMGVNSVIIKGDLSDEDKIKELASVSDVITCEIEHIGADVLEELEASGINVQPSGRVVKIIQDKLIQKQHFQRSGVPVPPFLEVSSIENLHDVALNLGLPLMLKSRKGGYDGRGNAVLRDLSEASIASALKSLGVPHNNNTAPLDLYAEGWVQFHSEIAVIVVRSTSGETRAYPAVTAVQTDSICRLVISPARNLSSKTRTLCEEMASRAIDSLGKGATGVFGVELFVVVDDQSGESNVLLNEVAPRPHNTGHYTQDACAVSQFENHLRAICGLPLGSTSMSVGAAAMVNILGAHSGTIADTMIGINTALRIPRTTVHWYGKDGCRAGRKMGHVNVTADNTEELDSAIAILLAAENVSETIIPPVRIVSSQIDVGVIMGSTSDLPTMQEAVLVLKKFDISYEVDIVSAHRTPDKLVSYGRSAVSRGLKVIIAGAGGAAHLPGMIAALTPLPVIGVPIKTSTLNGQDSLLSIVQMPKGVPVATVAIGNAANAGLLAARILGCCQPDLLRKMESYQAEMESMVNSMSEKLLKIGSDEYLAQMENKSHSVNI